MSSRWTREDEDSYRLPEGMVRIAYDADTRQYTFLDTTDGTRYVSAPGNKYGTLVPEATASASIPKTTRTTGRRTILQAYDRPAVFADDLGIQQHRSTQSSMGHKRNPTMPASSRHHSRSSSVSGRKYGRSRSASFSDFVAPHLIARASNSEVPTAAATATSTSTSKPRTAGTRRRSTRSAPPSPPPPPYGDEKQKPVEPLSLPTDPLSSLPTLSSLPPPLPPKDYPISSAQQNQPRFSGTCVPRVAMRLTARVLGRTFGGAKGGQGSPKGQSSDDGWVVV